jgi:hypothetical protein
MQRITLLSAVLLIVSACSCSKKCINCTLPEKKCIECLVQGNTQNFCEGDIPGGITLEQIQAGIALAGGTCQTKNNNIAKEEQFCWNDNASENTAKLGRITLEDKGYTCVEK